jgi:phosphatidate phosphatase APP1
MLREKEITVFPTYGYRTGDTWTVPIKVWVHKQRRLDFLTDDLIRSLLDDDEGGFVPSEQEVIRCRECVADFITDDDSGEEVSIVDEDGRELYGFPSKTDFNGLVEGEFTLPDRPPGWITIKARVDQWWPQPDYEGRGRVRLLEPEGKSVVSDIDDTIKVSEIPAGTGIVLRNTFLRDYVVAEGMLNDFYSVQGDDVSFHYVSGSPWQLFRLLHAFLVEKSGFPEGTFHMKSLQKSPLDPRSFIGDLRNFIAGKEYTKEMKVEEISELMRNLPGRRFTLIGDSGELDPEAFTELRETFGGQVEKIIIRDVVNAREKDKKRFAKVDQIVEADLIEHGQTRFK